MSRAFPIVASAGPSIRVDHSHDDDQLSEVEDLFTPDKQAALDAPLVAAWKVYSSSCDPLSNYRFLAYMLLDIVQSGHDHMKTEFLDVNKCLSLLENNPQIVQALLQALEEGSLNRIRRLTILRLPINEPLYEAVSEPDVIGAWKHKYSGHCHRDLLNSINAMDRKLLHSNTAPIIQSSGTGKSRTVDEQAKLVFTIPFNLRADKDKSEFAFPLPDCSIRDYFLHDIASQIGNRVRVLMLHFWIHLFDEITAIVAEWKHTHRTYTSLASKWYKHLLAEDHRRELYECVVQKAQLACQTSHSTWHELVATALKNLNSLISTIDSHIKNRSEKEVKVMIYFDEAYALADTTLTDVFWEDPDLKPKADNLASLSARLTASLTRPWTLYDMVMWCFACFRPFPIFALFLSTTSKFSLLAPTINVIQSAGDKSLEEVCLQPPIVEFPFDECPDLGVQDGCITFSELKQVQYLAKFGRTIFWAYMDSIKLSTDDPTDVDKQLLGLARTKLVQTPLPQIMYNMTARTALLDVRLMFNYQPDHERARKMQEDLVASHLRLAYSVPQHREYMRSGYSSEPLVAEAAAQTMHMVQQSHPSFMVNTLRQVMELGIIDLGERGEIIGRALLMKAYDDAVRIEQPSEKIPNFSAGCTVINFIEQLFVPAVSALILDSIPSNCGDTKFKDAFKNARVRFTHFVRLDNETLLCPSGMFIGFARGMAFICRVGEFSIDFAIPVAMLKHDNEPISQHSMTTFFIQIKRRIKGGSTNAYQINEDKMGFFPRGKAGPQQFPYVTLVMELGVLPAGVIATSYKNPIGIDKSTEVPSKVLEGTDKSRKGKGKGKGKHATPVPKDNHNVTSRKRKMSQREVTPEASTSKMRRGENDTSIHGVPQMSEGKESADGTITFPGTPSKVKIIRQGQLHHPPAAHPCYSIFAYGCSNTVYKVIRPDERVGYAALIANRNLLMEHPRQDVASITYVRRMKYRWNSHNDTCHWVYFTEGPFVARFEDE